MDPSQIIEEYEEVERESKRLGDDNCTVAKAKENMEKNRWRNILPFDDNRVTLEQDGSFYINASTIELSSGGHHYIATQGPLPNTTIDFWRMVWEKNVDTIIMLCKVREAGRIKCHKYWPSAEAKVLSVEGEYEVELLNKQKHPSKDYTRREFRLKNLKSDEEPRNVTQFHYKAWPDFGVPEDPQSLIDMRNEIRERQGHPSTPHIVHCSAGVGRTGTWCAIDVGLDLKENASVKHIVKEMRQQRVGMVQTCEQYDFVCRTLNSQEKQHDDDTEDEDEEEKDEDDVASP